jgi:hypothetical protein
MSTLIAIETDPNLQRCYEYAVEYDAQTAREPGHPKLPYNIIMRVKYSDNSYSDWKHAYMGRCKSEKQAIERFADRIDPGRFILTFCHPVAEALYAAKKAEHAARKAADEAFRRFLTGVREAAETAEDERKRAITEVMEAARPKFQRMMVKIAVDLAKFPDAPNAVSALVYRGLAIHQAAESAHARTGLYYISHVASGKAVSRKGLSLKDARLCVWRLAQLTDWTRDEETVLKALRDKNMTEKALALISDPYDPYAAL